MLDLTILGTAGTHPGAGRVCSGYLLRSGDHRVLLDCGNGATSNLQRTTRFRDLDAVVVTHRHVDHCIDLIGMFYALKFHPDGPQQLDLYAAPEVVDTLTSLLSGDSQYDFTDVFRVRDVDGGDRFEVGPIHFELFPSIHPVPTVSVRVSVDGQVFAYSSDSAGGEDLVACARDADLFLCEATWQGEPDRWPPGVHLTATEAGRIATKAGARRLLLTHIVGSTDRARSLEEARSTFGGEVALAEDNETWSLQ